MSLIVSPNTPQEAVVGQPICFEGSSILSIPTTPLAPLDIGASGDYWTYVDGVFKRISGGPEELEDSLVISDTQAFGLQPFYIKACNSSIAGDPTYDYTVQWRVGVMDDNDKQYWVDVTRYDIFNNDEYWWYNRVGTTDTAYVYYAPMDFNSVIFIRSDGINLYFERQFGVTTIQDVAIPLPSSTTWRFFVAAAYNNNQINCVSVYKGSYLGPTPITWSIPDGGSIDVTGNTACFSTGTAGTYSICAVNETDPEICVDIEVADLYFHPVNGDCDGCAFTGQTVNFQSNGGTAGTLTAVDGDDNPVGTVIDALTWIAPSSAMDVTLTYTLDGDSVDCAVHVLAQPSVSNVTGDTITGLIPGDTFQIETNYGYPYIEWENLDCPNIVTPDGVIHIPKQSNSGCFGALDCSIRGRMVSAPDEGCEILNDSVVAIIRIVVDPMFPTPEFGGPLPVKWKPETPDFRVITNEFEGGCDETYIRNRVPIYRWTVRYAGLNNDVEDSCAN